MPKGETKEKSVYSQRTYEKSTNLRITIRGLLRGPVLAVGGIDSSWFSLSVIKYCYAREVIMTQSIDGAVEPWVVS
jgi:hypothetical protein